MFRKFSKSSSSLNAPAVVPQPLSTKHRLQTALKTASESNLATFRKHYGKETAPKPHGNCNPGNVVMGGEVRGRRATIATSAGKPVVHRPAVKTPSSNSLKPLPPTPTTTAKAEIGIGQKIMAYMPELFEEVDPIRLPGRFYTWEDPSQLDYVPLPPPPRRNVKFGRIATKPRYGPGTVEPVLQSEGFPVRALGGVLQMARPSVLENGVLGR
ncbi:hypothetical protein C8R46DRAFT_1024205 [Mycena filopes]|nr:hypothetical protein C8R46DRAFT_1024205 [Mycena filopes]